MGRVQTRPAYRGLPVNFCQEFTLSHVILCIGNNSYPHLDISLRYILIFQGSTMAFSGSHNNRQGYISEISFSPNRKSNKFLGVSDRALYSPLKLKQPSSRNHHAYSRNDTVGKFIPYLHRNKQRQFIILKGT